MLLGIGISLFIAVAPFLRHILLGFKYGEEGLAGFGQERNECFAYSFY